MSTEPASSITEIPTSTGFVGRRQELRELRSALDSALSGQGRLVMLVGEPGIGKTRTTQELTTYAAQLGVEVLWGRCYEEQGMPPYWPWVQALSPYARAQDPEQLRSLMGAGASDIAEVLPEVKAKLPDLPPPPQLDSPEYARFRLFSSINSFLKSVSQVQPLVLVLDDLHWADKSSLLLLEFVASEMSNSRMLVLGCYRDVELSRQHPLAETLAQLSREPVFRRTVLRGLTQEDTGRFVEVTAGVTPSPAIVHTIHAHAEGNPFFMAELVRLLQEQGDLSKEPARGSQNIRIPEGVREVIGRRLNRLSPECNETLRVASVIGREFALKQLERIITTMSEEQLIEALEEALEARLIEELPGRAEGYQFSHALIQETLASELSAARRVRLHARIAETIEEQYANNLQAHAGELAYHFAEAEPVLGTEKLLCYSLLAGEQALAAYAWEEALDHFHRALEAKGVPLTGTDAAKDAEAADLLFGLGRAQTATMPNNEMGRAVATLRRAFDYYYQVKDIPRAVAVANCPTQGGNINLVRAELACRALSLVPHDSHQAGRLLCTYGYLLYQEKGDYESAQEALGQALAIARREGDEVLELRTLVALGHVEAFHLRFQESLQYDLRAIELTDRVDDLPQETHARVEVASVLQRMGDLEGARQEATALLAVAERWGNLNRLCQALHVNMVVAFFEGNWPTARILSDRGLATSPRDPHLLCYRAIMEYTLGDFDQGEAYLDRLLEAMRRTAPSPTVQYAYPAMLIPMIAQITGVDKYSDVAETAAEVVHSSPLAVPVFTSLVRMGLALLAARRGDITLAREQYTALESQGGTMLGGSFEAVMSADRLLGQLARTMGNLDRAVAHFEDSLAFCRKAGYRPELAWTCHDYSETLLHRNDPGDQTRASSLLDEALTISSELGMRPLIERVVALQGRSHDQPVPLPVYPDGLTQREVEILRLIAFGKSNPEIAETLYISPRTVSTHVSNILNKINAANRTEAASYANRHGLV